jgi:cytoskeletal protein RodZ
MARRAPADYGVDDPTVYIDCDYDENGGADPEPEEPIPGWRKPIALVGWGVLVAVLIGLIIWGIMQLAQGAPPQEPATITTTPRTTPRTTPPPSSAAPVAPPTLQRTPGETTTPTADIPTASTEDTGTPTTTTSPSAPLPGAFPLPQLPSVITLPALPGLPTEITLPPGL